MSLLRTSVLGMAGQLSLGSLFVRLSLDAAQFTTGWRAAQTTMTASIVGMTAAVAGLTSALGFLSAREAIRFESSFAGVRKTVNATEEEFRQLEDQMRKMAREVPLNVNEINKVAEWAGQLGIAKESIADFTRVMVDMGVTTNLSAESAAKALARFANIMQMPHSEFQRLGSVIVELGNNLATTEEEIVNMGLRIAGAGKLVGMAEHQVLALAGALSSLGVRSEVGGSSISRLIREMHAATFEGGQKLALFAQTARMSSEQFVQAFREDAAGALTAFIEGLAQVSQAGGNVHQILDALGTDTIRLTDVILRSVGAGDTYAKTFRMAAKASAENSALTVEANKRYNTLESQLRKTVGILRDMSITVGQKLMPIIEALNNMLRGTLEEMDGTSSSFRRFVDSVAPAFIFVISRIGDIIYGWQLVIKSGEVYFLTFASVMMTVFSTAIEKIRSSIEELINLIIVGVNQGVRALNVLLPKNAEIGSLSLITLDKTKAAEMIHDGAQALRDALAEAYDELAQLSEKGTFSERFKTEYEKVTAVVVEENQKIVENVEETVEKVESTFKPLSERLRKALTELESMTTDTTINTLPALGEDLDPTRSVLSRFEDPMTETLKRLEMERTVAQEQLSLLEELGAAEIEMTEAVEQKKFELIEQYHQKVKMLQMAQAQLVFATASNMFEDLTDVAAATAGKQSGIYKTMFAMSKAFALADATVKIAQGIAGAAASGATWIDKLAGMAAVSAATASIVKTIQSTQLEFGGGRASGGPVTPGKFYRVGEEGEELFAPSVPGQIIPNDMLGGGGGGDVKVVINNYTDATATVTRSRQGDEQIVEVVLKRVKSELSSEIRDGRGDFNRSLQSTFNLKRGS